MKNNIKKIIALALCLITMLTLSLPAFATTPPPEYFDDVYKNHSYRFGDLNGDSQVTSADARLCLKGAAQLIDLDERQINAALVSDSHALTTSCARKILRVAANLDTFDDAWVHLYKGYGHTIESLLAEDGKSTWTCEVSPDNGLEVSKTAAAPQMLGCTDIMQTFTFIAKEAGTYDVRLKLIATGETEALDEIAFTIIVDELPVGGLIWDDWDVILDHLDTTPLIFEDEDGNITVVESWLTFDNRTGDGDAEVTIGGDWLTSYFSDKVYPFDFERLVIGDSEVDPSNYTVTKREELTIITLKEEYVKSLDNGVYDFEAQYKKAAVPVRLYVVRQKAALKDVAPAFTNGRESKAAWVSLNSQEYPFDFHSDLFERLTLGGEEIDPTNYVIHGHEDEYICETIILLKDSYVKTLSAGEYYFTAEFTDVDIMIKLTVE